VPRLQAMLLLATDALCVFNKPSGISVQVLLLILKPSPGAADQPLQGGTSTHAHMDAWAFAAHAAAAPWALPLSPRLVHRLDKGTPLRVCQAYVTWQPVSSSRLIPLPRHQRCPCDGQRQVYDAFTLRFSVGI